LEPVLDALLAFRSSVREMGRTGNIQGVLMACDYFRDEQLVPLGIRLEDKADGSVWKLADPKTLQLEQEQKRVEAERKAEKQKQQACQPSTTLKALCKSPPANQFSSEEFPIPTTQRTRNCGPSYKNSKPRPHASSWSEAPCVLVCPFLHPALRKERLLWNAIFWTMMMKWTNSAPT